MHEYRRIVVDGIPYYGKHLVLSAVGCNDSLLSITEIRSFIERIVSDINMVAYGEPLIARFGQGVEMGLSAVQLIETSAIVIHTNDMARDMYLDVFSCKGFSEEQVLARLREVFCPNSINYHILLRR